MNIDDFDADSIDWDAVLPSLCRCSRFRINGVGTECTAIASGGWIGAHAFNLRMLLMEAATADTPVAYDGQPIDIGTALRLTYPDGTAETFRAKFDQARAEGRAPHPDGIRAVGGGH
jgi:hypothetical protein